MECSDAIHPAHAARGGQRKTRQSLSVLLVPTKIGLSAFDDLDIRLQQNASPFSLPAADISCNIPSNFTIGWSGNITSKRARLDSSISEVIQFEREQKRGVYDNGYHSTFVDRSGKPFKVTNALIAKIVLFPSPEEFPTVVNESQLANLEGRRKELEDVATKFPAAGKTLQNPIAALKAETSRFQAGDRKVQGRWLSAAEFKKYQETREAEVAAEERRLAERRIAEEKINAEKRAIEQRAAEERAALERAAEKQRQLEQANAEQDLADAIATFRLQQEQSAGN